MYPWPVRPNLLNQDGQLYWTKAYCHIHDCLQFPACRANEKIDHARQKSRQKRTARSHQKNLQKVDPTFSPLTCLIFGDFRIPSSKSKAPCSLKVQGDERA